LNIYSCARPSAPCKGTLFWLVKVPPRQRSSWPGSYRKDDEYSGRYSDSSKVVSGWRPSGDNIRIRSIAEWRRKCLFPKADGFSGSHNMVLSIPNYQHITRRLRFLMLGSISANINTQQCKQKTDSPEANFRNMILLAQIQHALERHGLKIIRWTGERKKRGSLLLAPLAALVRLRSIFLSSKKRRVFQTRISNAWGILCGGPHLILLIQKQS